MANASRYLRDQIIWDLLYFKNGVPFYVALFPNDPGLEAGVITSEITDNIARRPEMIYPKPINGWTHNGLYVEWPPALTAGYTVTHAAVMDSDIPLQGNVLLYGELQSPVNVSFEEYFNLPGGFLDIYIS